MLEIFTKIADFTTNLVGLTLDENLGKAFHFFIEDTTKIFALLSVMIFIVSFFRYSLSGEKVRQYIEKKHRVSAYLLAVIIGSITPFCSCSSIPIFIAFAEAGVPFGVIMAFLITSPMVNELAAVVLAGTIGLEVTIMYVLTGMTVGVVGGSLFDFLKLDRFMEPIHSQEEEAEAGSCGCKCKKNGIKARIEYATDSVIDIIKKTWIFIVLGIGVGAFIHGYIPQEFFVKYASKDNIFAVPMAVLLGIPIYSSATGVIPIAEVLLSKGVPVGTALALIMSVSAVSLPELIILRKVLKPKMIAIFVAFLFVAFIFVGYLFNFIL